MNHDTAMAGLAMLLAALGLLLLVLYFTGAAPAGICLSKQEARHLWPRAKLYRYANKHCYSNRRGPPKGLTIEPVTPGGGRPSDPGPD